MPIKVLVVDDSALIRALLKEIIQADPELELVGQAPDAYVARDLIKQLNPDVLTLDVEMPRMDGLTFLEKLMRGRPMPVLMISSLTEQGSEATFRAMELLINNLLKLGARRNCFEAKVFGGGSVLRGMTANNIGDRNVEFVSDYLHTEHIPVVAEDLLDI